MPKQSRCSLNYLKNCAEVVKAAACFSGMQPTTMVFHLQLKSLHDVPSQHCHITNADSLPLHSLHKCLMAVMFVSGRRCGYRVTDKYEGPDGRGGVGVVGSCCGGVKKDRRGVRLGQAHFTGSLKCALELAGRRLGRGVGKQNKTNKPKKTARTPTTAKTGLNRFMQRPLKGPRRRLNQQR